MNHYLFHIIEQVCILKGIQCKIFPQQVKTRGWLILLMLTTVGKVWFLHLKMLTKQSSSKKHVNCIGKGDNNILSLISAFMQRDLVQPLFTWVSFYQKKSNCSQQNYSRKLSKYIKACRNRIQKRWVNGKSEELSWEAVHWVPEIRAHILIT